MVQWQPAPNPTSVMANPGFHPLHKTIPMDTKLDIPYWKNKTNWRVFQSMFYTKMDTLFCFICEGTNHAFTTFKMPNIMSMQRISAIFWLLGLYH